MRPGLFVPIKWRLPECPRLILPLAVNLKRFLAPRCVFNFNFGFDAFLGIAGNPLDNFLCRWPRRAAGSPPPPHFLLRFCSVCVARIWASAPCCPPAVGGACPFFRSRRPTL